MVYGQPRAALITRSHFTLTVQVRGDVGEVAPDGRVLRPARLTVQLEAPGAHRWANTVLIFAATWDMDMDRAPAHDQMLLCMRGLPGMIALCVVYATLCPAAHAHLFAGSRRGRRRPTAQLPSRPSPASLRSSAPVAACGAAATAHQ